MDRAWKCGYLGTILIACLFAGTVATFGQSASAGGNVLRAGGFEDEPALLAWDQTSSTDNNLIQQVGQAGSHGGTFIARLGGTPKTTDTLEQPIGALDQYAQSATLSFYWQVENPRPGSSAADVLYVDLVDASSGQIIPLGTLLGSVGGGWQLASMPFSPQSLGLYTTRDYRLHFEADIRSASSPTAFDLDDVSLTFVPASSTHRPVSELLPVGDPTLPPPVTDDGGDAQMVSTTGHSVTVLGTTTYGHNSDLPCTCSPPFTAHQQITLTAVGFTKGVLSASNIKVKFEVQGTATTTMLTPTITSMGNGNYTIVGYVPDSPQKNLLSTGLIKVKNTTTGEVGWSGTPSNPYSISSTGVETGFRWGFPDWIASNPTITAGATAKILGGDTFAITAPGLHAFTKCNGTVVPPAIFAKDTSTPPLKVKVKGEGFTNSGNAWTSTWTGMGAPTVCTSTTPCIATNHIPAYEVDLLNPDNYYVDSTDYGYPSAIYPNSPLKVIAGNTVTFTAPTTALTFGPGTGYGPTNSVGYGTDANANPVNIALHPIAGATNKVTFHGQNLYRIKAITSDDGNTWVWSDSAHTSVTYVSGPTYTDSGWGTIFTAWAPTHAPGSAKPYFATKDDPGTPTRPAQVNFTVEPSVMTSTASTACLISGAGCPLKFPATAATQQIESFIVGPGEAPTVQVTVGACSAAQGSCSGFTLTGSKVLGTPDSQGRTPVTINIQIGNYSGTGGTYTQSVTFPVTIYSSGVAIETRNINLWY